VFGARTLQTVQSMSIVVQKFGGTSVADPSRISAVADRVEASRRQGQDVVVVVSAMGQTTDELITLAKAITANPPPREMDMLLTAGERISMALLAMALDVRGIPAVSYTGSQAGILTDSSHGEARIREITGQRVRQSLGEGKVVIVAGFQGVDPERREVTTLGRGGSDTTAVALAAALGAEACEIYTDVDGVFTADPQVVPEARRIDRIGYHEMLALAEAGAGVLMPHSVEFAHRSSVPVHVRSSFKPDDGTWVVADAPNSIVIGLAHQARNGTGLLSIVGAGAASVLERCLETLQMGGIESATSTVEALTVTIDVAPELLEDAVRLLHRTLEPPLIAEALS
jgi:aspartate kinase